MAGGNARWLRQLESTDAAEVCAAAKALGTARDATAVEPLLKILERSLVRIDADEMRVKAAAVEALYQISDPNSVKVLGNYLSLPSVWLKGEGARIPALVAKTLGEIGSKRAIRFLVEKVAAADWQYGGKETIAALKRCDREIAIEFLLEQFSKSQEPHARRQLLEVLRALRWKSNDPNLRAEIAVELGNYQEALAEGAAAFAPLLQVVLAAPRSVAELHKIGTVRWKQCVEALVELGDKRAVPHFIELIKLENPSFDLQADCVQALTELSRKLAMSGDRSVLGDLRDTLRTQARDGIAVPIIDELEASGDAEAVDVLIERVSGRVEKTVRRAAVALGRLGDAKAILPILRARGVINDNKLLWNVLEPFAQARYLDSWLAALQEPQEDMRRGAANVLAMIKDARSLDALVTALGQAVSEFYGAESLESLLVSHGSSKEVAAMQYSAGFVRGDGAANPIRKALEDRVGVCISLATALGELGEARAAPALMHLLQDDPVRIPWPVGTTGRVLLESIEPKMQWAAAQALVKLRQPEVKEWLARHLQNYNDQRDFWFWLKSELALELAKMGDERGNEFLIAQLNSPQKMLAALYLVRAGDRRGNDWLVQQLDGGAAMQAAQTLAAADDSRGLEWLVAQLAKGSEQALRAALELGKLGDRRGVQVLLLALHEKYRSSDGQFTAITDALIALQEPRGVERLVEFLYYKNRSRDHANVVDALKRMLAEFGSSMDLRVLRRLAEIPAKATVIGQKAIYDDDAFANFPGSFAEKETVEPTYVDVDTEFDQSALRDLAAAEYARRTKPPPPLPFAEPVVPPPSAAAAPETPSGAKAGPANAGRSVGLKGDIAGPKEIDLQKLLKAIDFHAGAFHLDKVSDRLKRLVNLKDPGGVAPLRDWLKRRQRRPLHELFLASLCQMVEEFGAAIDAEDLSRLASIPPRVKVPDQKFATTSGDRIKSDFFNSMAEKENDGTNNTEREGYYEDVEVTVDQSRLRDLARTELARRAQAPPASPLPLAEPIAPLPMAIPIAAPAAPPRPDEEEIMVAAAAPGHIPPVPEEMLEEAIVVDDDVVAAVPVPPMPEPPYAVSIQAGKFLVICRCGSRYPVPFEFAGKRTKCKKCGQAIVIPTA